MKAILLTCVITLTAMTMFTACEKPDYQDPRYRSTH
jgi:hypothetical protein